MNPVPLSWMLIAFGVLVGGNIGLGRLAMHYHQQIGEIRVECSSEQLKADNLALAEQVASLRKSADKAAAAAKAAQARDAQSAKLVAKYRRELNDARKEDPSLDIPLSERTRERLRNYEAEYEGSNLPAGAPVPAGP